MDSVGNIFICNQHNIRRISGLVTTVVGRGGSAGVSDGVGSAAMMNAPYDLVLDTVGTIFVTDSGSHRIRQILTSGMASI